MLLLETCFRLVIKPKVEKAGKSSKFSTSSPNMNMQMGVPTFCKAFPWHFIVDRKLELVQIGSGFMRVFGCLLTTYGAAASTYFEFHRPRSLTLSFPEIVKRANTPFVLAIRKQTGVQTFPAEVSTPFPFVISTFNLTKFRAGHV